jgi:hypothetical protein
VRVALTCDGCERRIESEQVEAVEAQARAEGWLCTPDAWSRQHDPVVACGPGCVEKARGKVKHRVAVRVASALEAELKGLDAVHIVRVP